MQCTFYDIYILWWHKLFKLIVASVTYEQLKALLANHSVQLFDVRNPDEFQAGRIPDSINIPCESLVWLK